MTIGEFSLAYNGYLKKFILITGRNFDSQLGGGAYYYTADNIWGLWSQETLLVSSKLKGYEWEPYGLFTTSDLNTEDGKNIYHLATSWGQGFPTTNYGIYWYKTEFGPMDTPMPTLTLTPILPTKNIIQGDANGDGKVDLTDLGVWKDEYVQNGEGNADFNRDGKVDLADLGVWKDEYVK